MTSNERQSLIDYLREAIQQETDVITQERIIAQYDEDSEKNKPVLPEKRTVDRPQIVEYDGMSSGFIFLMWIVLIVSICMVILGFSIGDGTGYFVVFLGICMILLGGIPVLKDSRGKKAAKEENDRRQKGYTFQVNQIEKQYNDNRQKYYNDLRVCF